MPTLAELALDDSTARLERPTTGTRSQTTTEGADHAIPKRESLRRDRGGGSAPAQRLTRASVGANSRTDDKSPPTEYFRQFQSV